MIATEDAIALASARTPCWRVFFYILLSSPVLLVDARPRPEHNTSMSNNSMLSIMVTPKGPGL